MGKVQTKYEHVATLGEGATGSVSLVRDKDGVHYALKIMPKNVKKHQSLFKGEVDSLTKLNHDNIARLIESFSDRDNYYLVFPHYEGGDLFERIEKYGGFSEARASAMAKQMLMAIHECHKRDIVHRDIKCENFVFQRPDDDHLRLIDFGGSKCIREEEVVKEVCGSVFYVAPEVVQETYVRNGRTLKASDMWSLGVCVYSMVCGMLPFDGDNDQEVLTKSLKAKLDYPSEKVNDLSSEFKDFISLLITEVAPRRMTVEMALMHQWIVKPPAVPSSPPATSPPLSPVS